MRRAFLLVTVGIAAAIGLLVSIALRALTGSQVALGFGAATACLFVGSVFSTLRR